MTMGGTERYVVQACQRCHGSSKLRNSSEDWFRIQLQPPQIDTQLNNKGERLCGRIVDEAPNVV